MEDKKKISREEVSFLEHDNPAALFAAEVEGYEIEERKDDYERPITCRLSIPGIAYLDVLAKRKKTSRAQVMAELIQIGISAVAKELPENTCNEIEEEMASFLVKEWENLKKEGGK
jgi:hypothetical protein